MGQAEGNHRAAGGGERYEVMEGKTPEMTVDGARKLLKSLDTSAAVGLRDRASSPFSSTPLRQPAEEDHSQQCRTDFDLTQGKAFLNNFRRWLPV